MLGRWHHLPSRQLLLALAVPSTALVLAMCATSGNTFDNSGSGLNGNGSTGSNSIQSGGSGLNNLGGGGGNGVSDSGRPERCNEAGVCSCFNIASLGYGGTTGAQFGHGGTDSTDLFVQYLNTESSAQAAFLGCGSDIGCMSSPKPTLNAAFLAQYDVLIFQWMANSINPVVYQGNPSGATGDMALGGGGYWSFSSDELTALKTWVQGGGGVIVLSGYDFCPNTLANSGCTAGADDEIVPANQIVQALTDMSYTTTDTFGLTQTGNEALCLGDTNPVAVWANDALGAGITEVGGFHGRGIKPGTGTVDCNNNTFGVCAAHEDVGKGHVYVYTDEWVTYSSQWNPNPQPANYCNVDGSIANGGEPAVQFVYQTPQFWFNAISYASQATMCPFTLFGATAR